MIVKFSTRAGALTMHGDAAVVLLKAMGHSGTVPGAILAADLPEGLERLRRKLAEDARAPFITHDLDMAVIYANRVLLVGGGRIVADGPPEVVLADEGRLRACRVVPTSLLHENLSRLPHTGRFMRAEALALAQ